MGQKSEKTSAQCGPEFSTEILSDAPARGPMEPWAPTVAVPCGDDDWRFVEQGYKGRVAGRLRDVFDEMADQAARRGGAALFTAEQIATARLYLATSERVAAGNVKLSSITGGAGANDGRDAMDAYTADCEALRRYHRKIGTGHSMVVRRVRPSTRGGPGRRNISDRRLVDMVCLGQKPPADVLRHHGWAVSGVALCALREALQAILDRMQ